MKTSYRRWQRKRTREQRMDLLETAAFYLLCSVGFSAVLFGIICYIPIVAAYPVQP